MFQPVLLSLSCASYSFRLLLSFKTLHLTTKVLQTEVVETLQSHKLSLLPQIRRTMRKLNKSYDVIDLTDTGSGTATVGF
mmetsp:Transcript_203/g.543  ORF Transcript_203/g.543 Transcript_203/m.543 type:complete len:80 (+) Transcript_203:493-732(+)